MKEDKKPKDIPKAVPGGKMPHVGAKQQMMAAPGAKEAVVGASLAQETAKVPAAKDISQMPPGKADSGVLPEKAAAMPETLPAKMTGGKMHAQPATSPAPAENMPVRPGPFGNMPYMMQQVPLICCPYLMNFQCPMTYAMPLGAGPVPDSLLPYAGSSSMPAQAGRPAPYAGIYPPYGMGALPPVSSQFY